MCAGVFCFHFVNPWSSPMHLHVQKRLSVSKVFCFFKSCLSNQYFWIIFPVPPVPFLQQQSAWSDVFPSEKVVLNCSVADSSDWTFTWYRGGQALQDSDPSVSLSAGGSVLTVTAEAQTSSGIYSCKGHHKTKGVTTAESNKLQLSVYRKFYYVPSPTRKDSELYKVIEVVSFSFLSLISKRAQAHSETQFRLSWDVPQRVCHLHMQSQCVLWMGISVVP